MSSSAYCQVGGRALLQRQTQLVIGLEQGEHELRHLLHGGQDVPAAEQPLGFKRLGVAGNFVGRHRTPGPPTRSMSWSSIGRVLASGAA